MSKIVLLGDSIRMNYQDAVKGELAGHEVWSPGENCRFASFTLNSLRFWWDGINGADIIHWNNGIWDIVYIDGENRSFTSLEHYVEYVVRSADILKSTGAKLIFAETTPLSDNFRCNGKIMRGTIEQYNAAVVNALSGKIDAVDPLYGVILPKIDEYLLEDGCHLNEEGKKAAGHAVADSIKRLL